MKNLMSNHPKQWLAGAFIALLLAAGLARAAGALATPAESPARADIYSQSVELTAANFAEAGTLDGVEISGGGLRLAPGRDSGAFTSAVMNSPLGFTTDVVPLWQVDAPAGADSVKIETRFNTGGGWSDWLENPSAYYPVRDNRHSGNMIWVGSAQAALQIRVTLHAQAGASPQLNSLLLVFNDTSHGPTDADIAGATARISSAQNSCPAEKPVIVSRTEWGNPEGQDSPRRAPQFTDVTHVIVHQAETPNDSAPYQDWAGWVRSIWNFHANVLGWGDVGYNYLIDPNGVIYEGRAGGDNVVGIHDTHNLHSMGVGLIGCYGDCDDPRLPVAEPSAAMLESTAHLAAWKLGQNGIDPQSNADYNGLPNIPVIAGGRDVVDTSAPGENIYKNLPSLREMAAGKNSCEPTPTPTPALAACQISGVIFDKEAYAVGEAISLTVRLADAQGTPLGGANVSADVSVAPISAQATTGFGLVDRAGEYDGVYTSTLQAGWYTFDFTASDPTEQKFLPCTAQAQVYVNDGSVPTATPLPTTITETPTVTPTATLPAETPTPTPTVTETPDTPTPTPTPTSPPDTPTPTATATPSGPVLKIEPGNQVITVCTTDASMAARVENVSNLAAVQFEITYDPAVVQVKDADPAKDGVQVGVDPVFSAGFIAQNEVATTTGRISFAATLLSGSVISGSSNLINIDWTPQAAGISGVIFENVILASSGGSSISHTLQDGIVEVAGTCAAASGRLQLQGRADHSGVIVTNAAGQQSQTRSDGSFTIAGSGPFSFDFPGYLPAQANLPTQIEASATGRVEASLGTLTLLAGDINNDAVIDIFDLAYIAQQYGSRDSLADLNGDGQVDILDLVLAAGNFGQSGPLTGWQ